MSTLPEAAGIRAMHDADLAPTKAVLVAYLTEWTGGPRQYTPWRGVPKLGRVHRPFAIGPAERDAWMHCMSLALDDVGADSQLKGELLRAFAKVADHLASHHPATDHPATPHHAPAPAATGGPVTPGATR
jgi:hemoglobin